MSPLFRLRRFELTPNRLWAGVFLLWLLLVSGVFNSWFGGPGLVQLVRLKVLQSRRAASVAQAESQIMALSAEQVRLERSQATQQREIRRVLGYLRQDELLFDFSAELSHRLPTSMGPSATSVASRR